MNRHSATRPPVKGDLLIARPYLGETFFNHAVVLLLDVDSAGGLMGLSLNVPTDMTLYDLIPSWQGGEKIEVFCGGPCDTDRLFVLHILGDEFGGSIEVIPGLYIGGRIEDIVEYVDTGGEVKEKMRFFIGYSGWHSRQLREELEEETWALGHAATPSSLIQGCCIPFWRRELAKLGVRYRDWMALPTEAELN